MKENGVVRRRLSGKEADPYVGLGRKILGEMKNIMRLGGIQQLNWTKDLQNGVRIVVSSIFGQDEIQISIPTPLMIKKVQKIPEETVEIADEIIVGYADLNGITTAFRWTKATGMESLGNLGDSTWATAISADGNVIVGYYMVGDVTDYKFYAFRWTRSTGMESIATLGKASAAYGVSDDGSVIVGTYNVDNTANSLTGGFMWTKATGMVDITQDMPSTVAGVSGDGTIVIGQHTVFGAFRWTKKTGLIHIGSTERIQSASAISNNGAVIVGNIDVNKVYKWTEKTGSVLIGVQGNATGVSADGSVIVGDSGANVYRWTEDTGKVDIDMQYSGAVSSDGKIIVGRSDSSLAVRWTEKTGSVPIDTFDGAWSKATAIATPKITITQTPIIEDGL